ncbi:MAG: hypothetical protein IIZ54_10040 [Selenomonadaceae bacterium]|nr:hypothetical protein [Selenomonadaceae bacterium]
MLEKTLKVNGKDVKFKSSAAVLRVYRIKFGRDIFEDLMKLESSLLDSNQAASRIPIEHLKLFENVAYAMAYSADPERVPEDINEWLDQFEIFSIYEILPQILELWSNNLATTVEGKKKDLPQAGE